jgi:protoporphyrinogen oxidase
MKRDYETLILGGGPAALQLGYYLQRDGRSYRILEANDRAGVLLRSLSTPSQNDFE